MNCGLRETKVFSGIEQVREYCLEGSSPAPTKVHRLAHPCVTMTRNPVRLETAIMCMKRYNPVIAGSSL